MKKVLKKIFFFILIIICFSIDIYFSSCNNTSVDNTIITKKGAFVLYEQSQSSGPGDYSYVNLETDTVTDNIYSSSNSGSSLGISPDGIFMYLNLELFVLTQGNPGGMGKIYRINAQSNNPVNSLTFGSNPYSFAHVMGRLYCTNISGDYVTKLDLDFNIRNGSINVGPNPSEIVAAHNFIYVSKARYTTENSLAVIDYNNDVVTKAFFNAPPVSAASNIDRVFVTTYTDKKIYRMDSLVSNNISDNLNTMYFVALNGNNGKAVYKMDIISKTVSPFITGEASLIDIYGLGYEPEKQIIFIMDSKDGTQNGQVRKYDNTGVLLKTYDIGGKFPRRIALRY
jgi:hypothetical protein